MVRLGLSLIGVCLVGVLVAVALHARPAPKRSDAARTPAITASTPGRTATPGPEETGPEPTSSASAPPTTAPTVAPVAARLPLLVLNNSRIHGLATRAAGDLRAAGWTVRGTGNFRGRVAMTTVYYGPGQEAAARRLAAEVPKVRRVAPRFAGLPGSGLTVVVTRDWVS